MVVDGFKASWVIYVIGQTVAAEGAKLYSHNHLAQPFHMVHWQWHSWLKKKQGKNNLAISKQKLTFIQTGCRNALIF